MTTPSTTDDFVDPQTAALLVLCAGALNANLPTVSPTMKVVARAYGWPVNMGRVSAAEFPLLLIYRKRMQTFQRTTVQREQRCTFVFEYSMGPTPNDRIGKAWNLLSLAWDELVRVVGAGHDPAVSGDAEILRAAGFIDVDQNQRIADFVKPTPGEDVNPSFVGTMILSHRKEIDISALQDLLELDAQYRVDGLDEPTPPDPDPGDETDGTQPLVRELLTT